MILVSKQADIVSKVDRMLVEWPATIASLAPDWGEELRCARNGGEVPRAKWGEVLADRDHVHFYRAPGFQIALPFSAAVVSVLNQIALAVALSIISRLLLPAKKPNKRDQEDSANNGFSNLQSNDKFEGVPMPVPYGRHRMAPPIINQVVRTSLDASGNPISEVSILMLVSDGEIAAIGDKTADGGAFSSEDGTFLKTLQINGQPAENFEDVEAHVRLGSDDQESISGFANPSLQYGVAKTLTFPRELHKTSFAVVGAVSFSGGTGYTNGGTVTLAGGTGTAATFQVTSSGGVPTALTLIGGGAYSVAPPSPNTPTGGGGTGLTIEPDFDSFISAVGENVSDPTGGTNTPGSNTAVATAGRFAATSTNVTKWDNFGTPVAYTMGDEADEFSALISLPQGLGDFTGANPSVNTVAYQVRYRAVDTLGVPFGDYIVLDPERLTLARQGAFKIEYRKRFYDPSTSYLPPINGQFLRGRTGTNGTTNRGASVTLNQALAPVRSKANSDFSFACWQRTNAVVVNNSGDRCIFNWLSGVRGVRLDFQIFNNLVFARLRHGDGTAVTTSTLYPGASFFGFLGDTTNWKHLVFTYDADGGGLTTGKIRIYLDGSLRYTTTISQIDFDMSATIRVQSDSLTPTAGYNCDMDEPTFWSRTLSAFDVARLYNSRVPLGTADDAFGLLVGGRFDGTAAGTGLLSFGPIAGSNWVLGDGNAGDNANPNCSAEPTAENGIVKTLESGVPTRGRYLVEIQRLTIEDAEVGLASQIEWETIELATYQDFCFPGCGLLAVRARASDQLSGQPLVTVRVDGRLVPVWNGVDPVYPTFVDTWSRNPAWIACDIILNRDYGLGNVYGPNDIDVAAFKELADYCDELIYDNLTRLVVVDFRQIDAADNANLPLALQGGTQDWVRIRVDRLPPNWPQPTSGLTSTGKFSRFRVTGSPSSVPAWLTTQIAAAAQEIQYVEFVNTGSGFFYVYLTSSAAIGATTAVFTPTVSTTDYIEGEIHDVRYRYDGIFDRADVPALDALTQVLQVARAVPVKMGRRFSVFCDKPGSPVAIIGMGNIVPGSFRGSSQGISDRPNVEQAEFFDEDLNWERSFETDELPDVTDPSTQSAFNFRRVRLEGVTRRGQAKRHLRRDLNTFNLIRKMKSFETGVGGLPIAPGDIIGFSHDVPGFGTSGRLYADSASSTTVKLDRPVTLEAATTYQIQVENAASNTRETRTVSSAAGTYAAGATISVSSAFSFVPDENDVYAIGVAGNEAPLYRVIYSSLDPTTLRRKVRALEYNEDTYSDDFGVLPETSPTTLPTPSAPVIPPGVENLVVTEQVGRGPDGSVRIAALVSFEHFAETYSSVAGADVFVSEGTSDVGRAGATHVASLDKSVVQTRIEFAFERHRAYTVWVVPRSVSGARYRVYATFAEFTPRGMAVAPPAPHAPSVTISGEMAVHQWEDAGDLDHGAVVEIRQGGWILGVPIATAPAQARRTNPVAAWAASPTNALGAETPELVARTKARTGQYSAAVRYTGVAAVVSDDGNALESNEEETW